MFCFDLFYFFLLFGGWGFQEVSRGSSRGQGLAPEDSVCGVDGLLVFGELGPEEDVGGRDVLEVGFSGS